MVLARNMVMIMVVVMVRRSTSIIMRNATMM